MQGILNVNKPPGVTSFSIVAQVRRLASERRVGHAGTLDPMATGVLPVLLGAATRITEYLMDLRKTYGAVIRLGAATDTYDATGNVTFQRDIPGVNGENVRSALKDFTGEITQLPPMFSAVKHGGKPLYLLARKGETIERKPRRATVYRLELLSFTPPLLTIEIECSRGTYIRSLAHDLGQMLGCGAHLESLTRLSYGPFDIQDAITLPELEEAVKHGNLEKYLYPLDFVLTGMPAFALDAKEAEMARQGQMLTLEGVNTDSRLRAYTNGGGFLGILRFDAETGKWHPEKVFL